MARPGPSIDDVAYYPTVASSGTLTLPSDVNAINVTGTTGITSITAADPGRVVVLRFAGVVTVTDGSNLSLKGNFTSAADDVLILYSDGTNWVEVARSNAYSLGNKVPIAGINATGTPDGTKVLYGDGTWASPGAGSETLAATIIDAKGDLIVGTAADTPTRLAVGSNNYGLVADSTQGAGVKWAYVVLGSGDQTDLSGNKTTTGDWKARTMSSSGVGEATSASRYVGAMSTGGAPTSGTFAVGDFVIGHTGTLLVCTVAGSPGTWVNIVADWAVTAYTNQTGLTGNKTSSGTWTAAVLSASGITGATTATRYVGGTASGAPSSGGPFSVGDWVVGAAAKMWVCTGSGSPGSWLQVGADLVPTNYMTTDTTQSSLSGNKTSTGNWTAAALSASGLTGATTATRYVGGNAGNPGSGTFNTGDFIIDAGGGTIRICTSGGSPGTWTQLVSIANVSQSISGAKDFTQQLTAPSFKANGVSPANTATRYMGGTTGSAPASGTWQTGDWVVTTNGTIHICTSGGTPGTWTQIQSGAPSNMVTTNSTQTGLTGDKTSSGIWTTAAHGFSGLTGATTASRYVGSVIGSPGTPTSGTFVAGDWILDQYNGTIKYCVTGGSPGTWADITGAAVAAFLSADRTSAYDWGARTLYAVGISGASSVSRWAGATASGAPSSGTFNTGDFVIARNGKIWVCTSGGSPGTWADVGGGSSAIAATIVDAKGDLIVATANDTPARLAVGSNNTVLIADSSQTSGVRWGTLPAANVSYAGGTGMSATDVEAAIDELATEKANVTSVSSQTGTYSATTSEIVLANGTFTVTLPAVASGLQVTVKNTGTGTITLARAGGALIDGATSQVLDRQYASLTVVSDGTDWFIT